MTGRHLFVCGDLHNLGDLALLLQNLAQTDGADALVRRWAPLPPAILHQVEAAGGKLFDGRSASAFWRARGAKVVIGGGQLIRDNISLRSLGALWLLVQTARMTSGTVEMRGLGVSPIGDWKRRLLWRQILKSARKVCVRDRSSYDQAVALSGRPDIRLTADMAFLPSRLHDRINEGAATRDTIAIAPCRDGSERRSIEGPAFTALVAAAHRVVQPREIVYLCHDPRPGMDVEAAKRLSDTVPLAEGVIRDGYDLNTLFASYGDAALVITNRLHAAIFALLGGRSLVVVDDGTHKIADLAERFAIPSVGAMDRLADMQAEQVIADSLAFDQQARQKLLVAFGERAALNLH